MPIRYALPALFFLTYMLGACGGGGGSNVPIPPAPPASTGTISGAVSGTEIIAVNDNGDVVASDDTAGKTPDGNGNYPFTLTGIPVGANIRVYLITGAGVFALYFDSDADGMPDTNAFSLSTVTNIDLGFVDTAVSGQNGRAIPDNNPTDVAGVSAGIEDSAVPANASLIGTWGFGRLKHRNINTWAVRSGRFTYNADGTGGTVWQENDNDNLTSGTSTWIWSAVTNPDGSITLTRTFPGGKIKTRRIVISDNGMVMVLDGTDQNDKQRFRVAVRMDTAKTYTNADLNGVYYNLEYTRGNAPAYRAFSSETTADGAGTFAQSYTANDDGTIVTGVENHTYAIGADGSTSIDGGMAAFSGLSGDGGLAILASSTVTGVWSTPFAMKKADQTYTTSDLAGTWAYMSFQDNVNGTSFASAFGAMVCDDVGVCTASAKFNRDGIVTVAADSPAVALAVKADGSFGESLGPATPAYAAAIGNNGNVFVINPSFEDLTIRRTIVGVRCSACTELATGGGAVLTQLTNNPASDRSPNWSADGTKIVFKSDRLGNDDIWVMDADGNNPVQLTNTPEKEGHPHFSPDGSKIVFWSERTGDREVWTMNSDGSGQVNISNNAAANDGGAGWSPDGAQIVFRSDRAGNNDVWIMNADGANPTPITTNPAGDGAPQFSPDGTKIAFWSSRSGNSDLWIMDADGSNQVNLTANPASDRKPHFSADGTRIVFYSDRSGNNDVWIMNSDGSGPTRITTHSADDGIGDFNPDASKIVFRSDRSGNDDIWTYTFP